MKRDLRLYIDGQQADLDGTTLVQFNYTAEELTNPTIVKNSYSQQVTLKGTANNNKLFGSMYRLDRSTVLDASRHSGLRFQPMKKTPFVILDEKSAIVERGYMRLDNIERKGANVAYKITLFGGLGEFFYNLSYTSEGAKKSLASLQYTKARSTDGELDFTISASTVLNAWRTLQSANPAGLHSIVNFAPAYNGIPDALSPDKAIIRPNLADLQSSVTVDGKSYGTVNGWAFVELEREYTEWQTKDLRSYLQRPVVSMRKIIEACCNPTNNGGYSVTLDPAFFNENNPYYTKTWLTLPLLNTLEIATLDGETTLSWNTEEFGEESREVYAEVSLRGSTASLSVTISPTVLCSAINKTVKLDNANGVSNFIRCRLRTSGESAQDQQTSAWVSFGGESSTDSGASRTIRGTFTTDADGIGVWNGQTATLTLSGVSSVTSILIDFMQVWNAGEQDELYLADGSAVGVSGFGIDGNGSASYEGYLNARSGSRITKELLLSTDKTPADYFVGYCKMFGLQLLYDKDRGEVSILTRNTLYNGTTIDLTDRIDYGSAMKITPFVFDKKWYNLGVEYEEGDFAEYYAEVYGRRYGLQRVNTGYEFDAEEKELLDGVAYQGAVEVLEREKYMLNITRGGVAIPAVALDSGHKYQLFDASGESTDIDFPTARKTDTLTYFNDTYKGYDRESKAQFHGKENEASEQRDVLLFLRGFSTEYTQFQLSDDLSVMGQLNDGEPCWMLNGGTTIEGLPLFGRYLYEGGKITHSLDFGVPAELDMPEVEHDADSTIYDKGWARYLADRYDVDTKVVSCKVDFRGITIGAELLRNFYYFDGCVWVLNKIKNYNVADVAPMVECEIIKVKNRNNYTTGQTWQQ